MYAPLLLQEMQLVEAESGAYIHSGHTPHTVDPSLDA
jgi:hypothetical protein